MNLLKLRQRLAALKAEGAGILDASGDVITEEDESRMAALDTQIGEIGAQIASAEKQAARALEYAAEDPSPRIVVGDDRSQLDPMRGFSGAGEFAAAVFRANPRAGGGNIDPRLLAAPTSSTGHVTQGSTDGEGYLVPEGVSARVFELVFNEDDFNLLNMVETEPTNSTSVRLAADETTPWGATGIQAYWGGELGQMTSSKINITPRRVEVHKLYAFASASSEELADAPLLGSRITAGAARAIRWKANSAIVEGNGAGKPKGWREGPGLVTVAKETSQTADTVNATNVSKMYSRLLPGGHARAFWLCHPDVMPQLMTMTIGDQPIWSPPNAFMAAPGGFLLGRPVYFSQHSTTVGDLYDIELVDPRGYYVAMRQGIEAAQSMHLYFDYDAEAFRWTFRMGGDTLLSAAVSPQNGASTMGHFITLAARA